VGTAGLYVLPSADELERDLREVDAAIAMIASGAAIRVRLIGLRVPDEVAPVGLARAQAAGIGFRVDRLGSTRLTFGPQG
jgi:hypothetical protein